MSQQGDRHAGQEDDWWRQLYDEDGSDTGPSRAADTLDDRFASAATALRRPPAPPTGTGGAEDAEPEDTAPEAADAGDETPEPETEPAPDSPQGSGERGGAFRYEEVLREDEAHRENETLQISERISGPRPGVPEHPAPAAPPARPGPGHNGPAEPGTSRPEPRQAPPPEPTGTGDEDPVEALAEDPAAARPSPPVLRVAAPWEERPEAVAPRSFPSAGRPASETDTAPDDPAEAPEPATATAPVAVTEPEAVAQIGGGAPTYEAEPVALPEADPEDPGAGGTDTVLDGARIGPATLRAVSVRGDSARYRGEPRRDHLLTARFGTGPDALVLVAVATGTRATAGAYRAAADACTGMARAVGRSRARLAEDLRAGRRGDLKAGLHRLTDRALGRLRARAADLGLPPEEYAAALRCLLLPGDPQCRNRVVFGAGEGGAFRLRDGAWEDLAPVPQGLGPDGDLLTMRLGVTTPGSPYPPDPRVGPGRTEPAPGAPFVFRASVARPGDVLLLCTEGLAAPMRDEPALAAHLADRWSGAEPPGLAAFLVQAQARVQGYADDRTAAAIWEGGEA
ncbi:protein phosphatase 2C domain-containing protein [Streptomyces sp. NPDC058045]|uniref:protein phosphatase 2C domain-containing protein n=1 Tax=Streptomyces sp. NPDC058045 TaxID=3346311 RepID=UPI0036EDEF57